MITFKNILQEAGYPLDRTENVGLEQLTVLIKERCGIDTLPAPRIFRGKKERYSNSYVIINPLKEERISRHTSNVYTLLIDNNPLWNSFPKRSRSVICTTSFMVAAGYGYPYVVLPYKGAKFGICPESDIWNSFDGTVGTLDWFNDCIEEIAEECNIDVSDIDKNWGSLRTFFVNHFDTPEQIKTILQCVGDKIKNTSREFFDFVISFLDTSDSSFLTYLMKEMSPSKNGFRTISFEHVPTCNDSSIMFDNSQEVWTDSQCVLVDYEAYMELFKNDSNKN